MLTGRGLRGGEFMKDFAVFIDNIGRGEVLKSVPDRVQDIHAFFGAFPDLDTGNYRDEEDRQL
jgi:hypothetical protein